MLIEWSSEASRASLLLGPEVAMLVESRIRSVTGWREGMARKVVLPMGAAATVRAVSEGKVVVEDLR